jgi:arylsulfatase A-like enzyme
MTRNAEPRNVLFISADQWRGECLSVLGHRVVRTPNLDRLASEGALFTRHYAQVAPCGPARASLLTGLYAMNHRSIANGTPLDARHTNVALEARRGGYDPVLIGYTDTSMDPRTTTPADPGLADYGGVLPGFREVLRYDDEVCVPWLTWLRGLGYDVPLRGLGAYLPPGGSHDAVGTGGSLPPPVYRAEHSDTAYTANRVIDWLEGRSRPGWFVHAVFLRPHPPLYAPEPYDTMYDPASVPAPSRRASLADELSSHPFLQWWGARQRRHDYYQGHPTDVVMLPDHEIRRMRASYYALISEVDHHVGRLIDYLQATGQYDSTLIVFTVDHGEQLGDHWLWGKGGYFDASYHIPLIVRAPGRNATQGTRVEAFTESVDVMPTILEWLDLPIPASCDGGSLLPWLGGEGAQVWRDAVHWEYDFRNPIDGDAERSLGLPADACTLNVLRDTRYKLVHFTDLPPLLFDLEQDPGEFENRAGDPAFRGALLSMTRRLLSLRMRHADRTLSNVRLSPAGPVTQQGSRYR